MSSLVSGFESGFESLRGKVGEIIGSRRAEIHDAVNLMASAVASAGISLNEYTELPKQTQDMMSSQRDAETLSHIQNLMQGTGGSVNRELVREVVQAPEGVIQSPIDVAQARENLNAVFEAADERLAA